MNNSGEPNNYRRLYTGCSKKISTCKVRNIMGDLEETLGTGSPGMDYTFWNPLPCKVRKFLNQMIILKENGTSRSNGQGVVVVPDRSSGISGHEGGIESA